MGALHCGNLAFPKLTQDFKFKVNLKIHLKKIFGNSKNVSKKVFNIKFVSLRYKFNFTVILA